jgi:hypothetical protein
MSSNRRPREMIRLLVFCFAQKAEGQNSAYSLPRFFVMMQSPHRFIASSQTRARSSAG